MELSLFYVTATYLAALLIMGSMIVITWLSAYRIRRRLEEMGN